MKDMAFGDDKVSASYLIEKFDDLCVDQEARSPCPVAR
jgi:hypothetical protein